MTATEITGDAEGSASPQAPHADTAPKPAPAPVAIHDPSTTTGQLGLAFKRAMVAVRKLRGRETHRPGQISYAQYGLLFGLAGKCECSARELAEQTELAPATVAQMLEHLEAAGLVERSRSEQDRRIVLSALTERGAAVVAERHAQMEPRWQAALAEFTDEDLSAAARVLNSLADYFESLAQDSAKDA